jgi:hypothetical protein
VDTKDYAAGDRVYDRFLSVVEPGCYSQTVLPLELGKRKTGTVHAPCAVQILQEMSRDIQVATDLGDHAAHNRIYLRFLAYIKTGVVSRSSKEQVIVMPVPPGTQDKDCTSPHPRPP